MTLCIKHFEEIGSTNDFALKIVQKDKLSSDIAVIADVQTDGRGRLNGRVWHSPLGNFYCSYILNLQDLNISQNETNTLTSEAINILERYLRKITNSDLITQKQPNDILVHDKKLAGVLTEISYPYVIIGIGINLIISPIDSSTNLKSEFNFLVKPMDLVENLYEYIKTELMKCHSH